MKRKTLIYGAFGLGAIALAYTEFGGSKKPVKQQAQPQQANNQAQQPAVKHPLPKEVQDPPPAKNPFGDFNLPQGMPNYTQQQLDDAMAQVPDLAGWVKDPNAQNQVQQGGNIHESPGGFADPAPGNPAGAVANAGNQGVQAGQAAGGAGWFQG